MRCSEEDYKEGALVLLVNVLVMYGSEEAILFKALDEFSEVYREQIPDWFEIIYQFFSGYPENELQMAFLNKYATQHQIKIETSGKLIL